MRSVNVVQLEIIEETRRAFHEAHGKLLEDEKRLFVNWYVENTKAPLQVLINDLSEYYLHISEDRILRYLNQ